jgi:hypothetical protein
MKYLKTYKSYKESILVDLQYTADLMESMNIWGEELLKSINAEELDIFDTLKLPKDFYTGRLDLDFLQNNVEFINSLSSVALRKSQVNNSDDFESFINKPCKFMFIYGIDTNDLEQPTYVLIQNWNQTLKKWDEVKFYKVNDDAKKFYDKLSSKTVEVLDGDQNYIYVSNNGNEWNLQNVGKENDTYKKVFRKDEFDRLLNDRKVKVKII